MGRWWLVAGMMGLVGCESGGEIPTGLADPNRFIPQVFEGTVTIDSLTSLDPAQAIPSFELGELTTMARVFARPPVGQGGGGGEMLAAPGVESGFVERWVYESDEANDAMNEFGFLMVYDTEHSALCSDIEISVDKLPWNDPQFSQQVLDYVEPPETAQAVLEGATAAVTFTVYQPGDDAPRGWLFRVLPPPGGALMYQDHWLLTGEYQPLGDGGTHAIVVRQDTALPDDLEAWYGERMASKNPASTYTVTTYGISGFPETCIAP